MLREFALMNGMDEVDSGGQPEDLLDRMSLTDSHQGNADVVEVKAVAFSFRDFERVDKLSNPQIVQARSRFTQAVSDQLEVLERRDGDVGGVHEAVASVLEAIGLDCMEFTVRVPSGGTGDLYLPRLFCRGVRVASKKKGLDCSCDDESNYEGALSWAMHFSRQSRLCMIPVYRVYPDGSDQLGAVLSLLTLRVLAFCLSDNYLMMSLETVLFRHVRTVLGNPDSMWETDDRSDAPSASPPPPNKAV